MQLWTDQYYCVKYGLSLRAEGEAISREMKGLLRRLCLLAMT